MPGRWVARSVFAFVACAVISWGQDSRGSISGVVTDPQGALIPNAAVIVTNAETNVSTKLETNSTGYYQASLLNPGTYTVVVEATGFKRSVRNNIQLSVAGRVDIPVTLELGDTIQTVEVTATAPLLDTTTASGGRIIDARELRDLPFPSMNPLLLQSVTAGMQYTGTPGFNRWFDHAGTSSYNAMGNVGSNEYMLDGAPITGTGGRVGFVPTSEAVSEFKIETLPLDASYSYTAGAVVNMSTRAGTNTLHGNLFEQHYQSRWHALPHFSRLAWEADVREGRRDPNDPKQPAGRYNQYGGSLSGPIYIPKLLDGRNKLFFAFTYSAINSSIVRPDNFTVPQEAWKTGDFSQLLEVDPVRYTIYDPRSARLSGSNVVRQPFPGNKGIPILNPAYEWWVKLYPKANNVPGIVTPEGINNYYSANRPFIDKGGNVTTRIDYNISDKHRTFGKYFWNDRHSDEWDWAHEGGYPGLMTQSLLRYTKGASFDYLYTINTNHILNAGANFSRYNEGGDPSLKEVQVNTKPSDLNLPAYIDEKAGEFTQVPDFNIAGISSYAGGRGAASYPKIDNFSTNSEAKIGMTSIFGRHSFKYGWTERRYTYALSGLGTTSGAFTFNQTYMRQSNITNTASDHGLGWAAFMMGLPSSATIPTNDNSYWSTGYRALYLQDDLRITKRLRFGLGLRYEYETGLNERFNRAIGGDFDFNYRPPFADEVEAIYARNVPAGLPPTISVMGGTNYLGANGRDTVSGATHNFLPNVSVVFSLNDKMVVRGGYTVAVDTRRATSVGRTSQTGYSRTTTTIITPDNGLTFCCGVGNAGNLGNRTILHDPFPVRADGTRFDVPLGNSMGPHALYGSGYTITPYDLFNDRQQRWRFSFQRELSRSMVVDFSYNGSYAITPGNYPISYLPEEYWIRGNVRDDVQTNWLNTNVSNPFNFRNLTGLRSSDPQLYDYLGTLGGRFTSQNIARHQLLRAYPLYTSLNGIPAGEDKHEFDNRNKYHDLQIQFERRYSAGLKAVVSYTRVFAKGTYRINEFSNEMGWQENTGTRPHRVTGTAIYELPLGKGRRWLGSSWLRHFVGGWQTGWVYQWQNGQPLGFGNRFFYGDPDKIGDIAKHEDTFSNDIHLWFDPSISYRSGTGPIPANFVGFEGRPSAQPTNFHVRVLDPQLSGLRGPGLFLIDGQLKRRFGVKERMFFDFSVDMFNVLNRTNFTNPNTDPTNTNFGRLTGQNGAGRQLQANLRFEF